jgi:uncharacterized protein (TIGR02145 family)
MRKKAIFWMLALWMLSAASVKAQVIIGSLEDPHGGAVLDLSQSKGLGLLLPRIFLTNSTEWQLSGAAEDGKGMLVYNTNEDVGNGEGIYVWKGDAWVFIQFPGGHLPCSGSPEITSTSTLTVLSPVDVTASVLTIEADDKGDSGLTYKWQSSPDGSMDWTTSAGDALSASYSAPNTSSGTFYYRCIVKNACGSVTSNVFTVNVCGTSVEDEEGNWYCYGDFGAAGTWMTMNLRSTYNDIHADLTANTRSDDDPSSKYYGYPRNSQTIFNSHPEHGLLYTWAAASGRIDTSENEVHKEDQAYCQGICPTGWHLPSDYEWSELEKEIAGNPGNYSSQTTPYAGADTYDFFGSTVSWRPGSGNTNNTYWGRQMKSKTPVTTHVTNGASNGLAANGFDGLLTGYIIQTGFGEYGTYAGYWSSSSSNDHMAWRRLLAHTQAGPLRNHAEKTYMYSVRCKKDDN